MSEELQAILKVMNEQTAQIDGLVKANQRLLEELQKHSAELQKQTKSLDLIRLTTGTEAHKGYDYYVLRNQLSYEETLRCVYEDGMSLARFGDGELNIVADPYRHIGFQHASPQLQKRLRAILESPTDGLLVCMPPNTLTAFWTTAINRIWPALSRTITDNRTWGNTNVSRPEAFDDRLVDLVPMWRKCWEGKKVAFVTGKESRFEPLPLFFDNISEAVWVDAPATNAFNKIDEIFERTVDADPDIALLSLGPSGTILASELHKAGIQALDIGHLSSSYRSAKKLGPAPENLPVTKA